MRLEKSTNTELSPLDLSAKIDQETKLRAAVAVGLGGTLLGGLVSCQTLLKNHPVYEGIVTTVCSMFMYFIYLLIIQIYSYTALDLVLFLVAINTRALKSIVAYIDTREEMEENNGAHGTNGVKEAVQAQMNKTIMNKTADKRRKTAEQTRKPAETKDILPVRAMYAIVYPGVKRNMAFERSFEEIIFRMCMFAAIQKSTAQPEIALQTLVKGLFVCGLTHGLRTAEYLLTGKTPPGWISKEMNMPYTIFVCIVAISEVISR